MPQIAQMSETFASQLFWLLLVFGILFFVVGKGMVPKVMDTVGLRDRQIADDLAAAQAARDAADAEEEAWRARENANRASAQALVGEAKSKAQASTEAKLADVQERLDAQMVDAETRIAASREAAAGEIETVAADAARDIVVRLAGVNVDDTAALGAVKKALANG